MQESCFIIADTKLSLRVTIMHDHIFESKVVFVHFSTMKHLNQIYKEIQRTHKYEKIVKKLKKYNV